MTFGVGRPASVGDAILIGAFQSESMIGPLSTALDRVRRPEYTGENRCVPCTVVNALLALVMGALASIVAYELAVVVVACSLGIIYLRGYLVPGTPTLTERYLPDRLLAVFDTHPTNDSEWETLEKLEAERRNAVDPERFLTDADVVERSDDAEYAFTDSFAVLLDRRLEQFGTDGVDHRAVADVLGVQPEEIADQDRAYPAVKVNRRIRKWPSDAALLADVATHLALTDATERWVDVPLEQRLGMLESLRAFHEVCPSCAEEIAFTTNTVESCCRSYDVLARRCPACDEALLEYDPSTVRGGEPRRGITS